MSTSVLATKLFAPTRRPVLVARTRLVDRLDAALTPGHRLALVSAPPGFGKTTVLADWLAQLDGVQVAWVSLDEGDNDLARLLAHVVAGLRGAGVQVSDGIPESVHAASATAAMTALVNDLAGFEGELLLVLDDYHVITAPPVHEAVDFLLEHLPAYVHLVLATRADPPLPLSRLRVRGELTEVRAADLRFTSAEAAEFLARVMGLSLDAAEVSALEERTEGWIAGLQLAGVSLQGVDSPDDVAGFVEAFAGSNRYVIDYLVDEVLARQSEDVREFLLSTAVLERLSGSLCDAVTGGADSAARLASLERANLFVVPLDADRSWWRYHHLFGDVLRARLQAERPDVVPELHRRASAWFASEGYAEEAVRHALAAEDYDSAAVLVEGALEEKRRARQDALLLQWLRSFPAPVVRRRPVLGTSVAWASMMSGDLDAASARLDDAEEALATEDTSTTPADELRMAPAMIELYRAALAQARGDVPATVRHAAGVLELSEDDDHFLRGAGNGYLGLAAWSAGNVDEALATFGAAVRSLHAAGNLVDELDTTIVLADMWVAAGQLSRARRLHVDALQRATAGGEPYPRATADLHAGLAELDRLAGDLASAEQHLSTARTLAERASITENRHRWFVVSALVRADRGDFESAMTLLDEAESLYRQGFYPDVRPIPAIRVRLQVRAGDLDTASMWAEGVGAAEDYLHEYAQLTVARLWLARSEGGRALGLLDRLHDRAVETGRGGSVLEIRALQALAQRGTSSAATTLQRALAEGPEALAHARLFLDEGEPMLALLREVDNEVARKLLAVAGASPDQGLQDPLSGRELEVLRLLDSELTGPQIARELYVSLNTLRTHTKRIFTKLDANTRAAAVRRAKERGLI